MNDYVKMFIESNIHLIDTNNFASLYEEAQKFLTYRDTEELLNSLISVGIDDITTRENMVIDSFKYSLNLTLVGEKEGYTEDVVSFIRNSIFHAGIDTLWGFNIKDLVNIFEKNKSIWSNNFNIILGVNSAGNLIFKYCG